MAQFRVLISGLRRAEAQLEKQLEGVRNAISSLQATGGVGRGRPPGKPTGSGPKRRRKMSRAARAKISAAQKARWAKQKGQMSTSGGRRSKS